MAKQIEISVGKDGGVVVKPSGYAGPACKEATLAFEQGLGAVVTTENTPEYTADVTATTEQIKQHTM